MMSGALPPELTVHCEADCDDQALSTRCSMRRSLLPRSTGWRAVPTPALFLARAQRQGPGSRTGHAAGCGPLSPIPVTTFPKLEASGRQSRGDRI